MIKKLFYAIALLIMLLCAGGLVLAFSPNTTKALSTWLYGENGSGGLVGGKLSETNTPNETPGSLEGGTLTLPGGTLGEASAIAQGVLADERFAGYVAPIRGSLDLPGEVSNKNGYEPIRQNREELEQEQADLLGSRQRPGETGDGLTFEADLYPYYHMLNSKMQHIYRQIYANASALNKVFTPIEQVNIYQLQNVFEAVYNDHPELFWLETEYSTKYGQDGICLEVTLAFNRTAQNLEVSKSTFESAAAEILRSARTQGDVEAKERAVHDALCQKIHYEANAPMNQSAYSALVNGSTVCAGYSRAFQYLMQQLGIPCFYCTGYSGEDHAWDIMKLGDGYVNVDVTWDDTEPGTYDYYNKSDADFVRTHVRTGLSVYLPACGQTQDSYQSTQPDNVAHPEGITLNPNPQQPLRWEPKDKSDMTGDVTVSGGDIYDLTKAGITESEVITSLKDYYADCLKQVQKVGDGQKTFTNIVPKYMLDAVESSYGTGDYMKGYVEEALKKLEKENFAIQIQVEDLKGNYFRLYHHIYTW